MAGNTIGQLFRVTTFGESHGIALGCIVDGVPPNLELSEADIQPDLDRRKPGTSRYTTPRRENDEVQILLINKNTVFVIIAEVDALLRVKPPCVLLRERLRRNIYVSSLALKCVVF